MLGKCQHIMQLSAYIVTNTALHYLLNLKKPPHQLLLPWGTFTPIVIVGLLE